MVEMTHQHPLNDDFWAPMRPDLGASTVPALVCVSWSDQGMHTRGSMEGLKQILSQHKWLYTHGRKKWEVFYSEEAKAAQSQFFDFFLKGIENGMAQTPRVRLEVRRTYDQYTIRYEQTWPVANIQYSPWYLDAQRARLVDADDMDVFVGIRKFDATGQEVHFSGYQGYHDDIVAKGWLRVSERELDKEKSTPILDDASPSAKGAIWRDCSCRN